MKAKQQQQVQPASLAPSMSQIVPIEKIPDLLESIRLGLLKDRTAAYVASALRLSGALSDEKPEAAKTVRAAVERFSKSARLLDMIMAIGGSAGYLAPDDRIAVESIRTAIQADLAPLVHVARDGMIIINTPDGSMHVETHSSFGRRMAGLMARVVPPTEQDKGYLAHYLGGEAVQSISKSLSDAKEHVKNQQWKAAIALYAGVLKIDRKNYIALSNLGVILTINGQYENAAVYLREALHINPTDVALLTHLGDCLAWLGSYDEAARMYDKALAVHPNHLNALIGKALLQFHQGNDAASDRLFDEILMRFPDSPAALVQSGQSAHLRMELAKAAPRYIQALKLNPCYTQAHIFMGTLRSTQRHSKEARASFERAENIEPDNENIQCAKAYFLLSEGEYQEGWKLYDVAIGKPEWRPTQLIAGKKIWDGESAPDKKLLIVSEQGLGDVLQFVRYAAMCKERVGKVYVLCPPALEKLLKECPYIDEVFTKVGRWKYDMQISMLSLPHIFGTTLETVPAKVPYLYVPNSLKAKWSDKMSLPRNGLRIGLVWSGSAFKGSHRGDLRAVRRNIKLQKLLPLFERQEIKFVNLQMGEAAKEIDELGLRDRFIDPMTDVKDMQDTAAIIQNLDLVISVDTSVVHLAGGLGKPVWVLSRYDACWRWLRNRPDSPWYPTAKVFGQPSLDDWGAVVTNLVAALGEMLDQPLKS